MEENKVVVMEQEEAEVNGTEKKGILEKVGSGIKKHWKTIAVGAGALLIGVMLGSRKTDDEVYEDSEEESEDTTETEE